MHTLIKSWRCYSERQSLTVPDQSNSGKIFGPSTLDLLEDEWKLQVGTNKQLFGNRRMVRDAAFDGDVAVKRPDSMVKRPDSMVKRARNGPTIP